MMDIQNVVYMVGKRTSSSSSTARHLDDGTGKPLCQHQAKSGKSTGGGYVLDRDTVTCKRCLKLMDAQPATEAAQAFGVDDLVTIKRDGIKELEFIKSLKKYRDEQVIGKVVAINPLPNRNPIQVVFPNDTDDGWLMKAEELELWKPAEPDEYTRDEEQARLIARIRELEEGYEAILSELVVARPFNDILEDVRAIAQRMLHAEDEPIGE